jgi:hypothetical protein
MSPTEPLLAVLRCDVVVDFFCGVPFAAADGGTESLSALISVLPSLLWIVLVVVLLVLLREHIARAIAAKVRDLEKGAPLNFPGGGIGSPPEQISEDTSQPDDQTISVSASRDDVEAARRVRRARAGLLRPHFEYESTAIVVGPSPNCRPRNANSIGTRDAFTLAQLHSLFGGVGGVETVAHVVANEGAARELLRTRESLVAVGGPASNPLINIMIDQYRVPVVFRQGGVYLQDEGALLSPRRGANGEAEFDFALVFGGQHPSGESGWCTAIAGNWGISTVRASQAVLGRELAQIQEDYGIETDSYALVLRLTNPGLIDTLTVDVEWAAALSPSQ